jgi:hypothetical protein
MIRRLGGIRWVWLWCIGYAAMVAAVVGSLVYARDSARSNLASSQSISDWQAWREEARERQDRREPKSDEPPGLVLMRDYFSVCLTGALLFTSLLYWVLAWFTTGMVGPPRPAAGVNDRPALDRARPAGRRPEN